MNVNLAEHQRSLLATMGIDLWIPKVDVQTRHFQNALYRDTALPESFSTGQNPAPIEFLKQHQPTDSHTTQQHVQQRQVAQHTALQTFDHQRSKNAVENTHNALLQNNADTKSLRNTQTPFEDASNSAQRQQQAPFSTVPAIQLDAFEIQAFCVVGCVILVDSTQLTAEQKTLWSNIQRAVSGEFYDLKWPFPMVQYQDGKGATMYIQGFVDALKHDRKIVSLGQITHLHSADMIQLASLQEMIDQPVLKRRLWQFMQSTTN